MPDALRLRQTCKALYARLAPVGEEAWARRLRWVEVEEEGEAAIYEVNNEGCALRRLHLQYYGGHWAVGEPPLPTEGASSWRVRVDESWRNGALVIGALVIGVCDAMRRRAWGLHISNGQLWRLDRPWAGSVPSGYPDGDKKQVLKKADGQPDNLQRRARGAIIEVRVDHDAGTLSFSVNDGPPLLALSGFPKGEALLPWALLSVAEGDRVSFASAYVRPG